MSDMNTKRIEINEKKLQSVCGGITGIGNTYNHPEDVFFKFWIGQKVELVTGLCFHRFTKQCKVIEKKADKCEDSNSYCAWYKVSCSDEEYNNKWFPEALFEGGYIDMHAW